MPLTSGTILGQYDIHSSLGAGGMGEVYRARDTRLDREVAIKVLPEPLTADPERLRRFEQEARAAAALNHPNILAVYQMATHEGVSYMVTELLEGETLRERMGRGVIPLRKAIDYGIQIVHGLSAAHEKDIVHRDLKPENLFITKDGRMKILDFGLAKLIPTPAASADGRTVTLEETEPGVVMGTVGYMSPEQVRGQAADHRSDIFAFGTILYEMVTRHPAFRKPTRADTISAILSEEPPSLSQLVPTTPPGLQRVVHRCLEKDPEQRFHSAHDLAFALEAVTDTDISSPSGSHARDGTKSKRPRTAVAIAAVALVLGATLTYFWTRPEPVPKVSNYIQLTHDGQPKGLVGTDGARLYLNFQGIAQVSVAGGEPVKIPTPSPQMYAADVSRDGSQLLLMELRGTLENGATVWSLPILGGSPRRLGDVIGQSAAWSPNGRMLAYGNEKALFVANADGTESRKVSTTQELVLDVTWSPDGTDLQFVTGLVDLPQTRLLWQVSLDGKNLHQLLPGWRNPEGECCGRWTVDGKYFLFLLNGQVWALPRKAGFLQSEPKPIQLTSSPMMLGSPIPSKDGKQLFVTGRTSRGELMRYNFKSGRTEPFLGGVSGEFVDFSKDGRWVTYVSYPGGILWRSKVDGSERAQLTFPPLYVVLPRWSPDGKNIVFFDVNANRSAKLFEVSTQGGSPRQLMPDDSNYQQDPTWSPDGNKIVFGGAGEDPASTIRILDLTTRQISTLPGSQGLYGPRWSPKGRYVAAQTSDGETLMLFDFQNQKWSKLTTGNIGWLNWSKDGDYVYFFRFDAPFAVVRMGISDRKIERVAELKNLAIAGRYGGWLGLAPDDSPLLLREAGTQDVYALDWEEP